jgi:hypothetical protein
MRDPRVLRAMQNPTVMQGLMGALQLRALLLARFETSVSRLARGLHLATDAEVRELRRTIRKLEQELKAQRANEEPASR